MSSAGVMSDGLGPRLVGQACGVRLSFLQVEAAGAPMTFVTLGLKQVGWVLATDLASAIAAAIASGGRGGVLGGFLGGGAAAAVLQFVIRPRAEGPSQRP